MPLNSPACCLPNIVAGGSMLQKTTSITPTAIFTPAASGLYKLFIYCAVNGSGSVALATTWQDDFSSQSSTENEVVIEAKAGSPINIAVTVSGSPTFNLYYSLVSLL